MFFFLFLFLLRRFVVSRLNGLLDLASKLPLFAGNPVLLDPLESIDAPGEISGPEGYADVLFRLLMAGIGSLMHPHEELVGTSSPP